ncbi:MAG: hypothetical protein OEZ10_09925 [Gammaproteobacteria bacterium]|nr:hypothetical protein [Gammaproteobacteria bacterium]
MRTKTIRFLIGLAAIFLMSCNDSDNSGVGNGVGNIDLPEIAFTVVEEGYYSQYGNSVTAPILLVYDNQPDFDAFWAMHKSGVYPPSPAPAVDFSVDRVLVVMDSIEGSSGYTLTIQRIVDSGSILSVYASKVIPGSGCFALTILTQPYQIVTIPTTSQAISFNLIQTIRSC